MKRMNLRVSISTLVIYMVCLLIINSPYVGQRYTNAIRLALEMVILFCMLFKYGLYKKNDSGCISISLYALTLMVSTYLIYGFSSRFLNSLVTGLMYILCFCVFYYFTRKYSYNYVVLYVRKALTFLVLVVDLFVVVTLGKGLGGRGLGGVQIEEAVYLLANKFTTSYLHMAVLALIGCGNNEKNKRTLNFKIIAFTVYSILICILTDTTTGIVGCVCVALLKLYCNLNKKIIKILKWPLTVISTFIGTNAVFLLSNFVLNNSKLTSFFLSRSHTGTILSGRVQMYQIAMDAIAKQPVWGYGINCDIVQKTLSFGNAQNGVLKILLDSGYVGLITFCLVLYFVFKNTTQDQDNMAIQGCIAFIYSMLICSLVEVNLSAIFVLICALMNAAVKE